MHYRAGELSCSPSGDRSRARLGEHLTLEDLEISTPDDHMPQDQRQAEEEDQNGWGRVSRAPIPTPSSSHPIGPSDPEVCGATSLQVIGVHASSFAVGHGAASSPVNADLAAAFNNMHSVESSGQRQS